MGNMIQCKGLKSAHTNKLYMYNRESVFVNEKRKILSKFEVQTDDLILTILTVLVLSIRKKKCILEDFAVSANSKLKKKKAKI